MHNSGIDYPTTGAWGQTDKQWHEGKTGYEKVVEARDLQKSVLNDLEAQLTAFNRLDDERVEFLIAISSHFTNVERESFERLRVYIQKNLSALTLKCNDARNKLKKLETDVYNYRERR